MNNFFIITNKLKDEKMALAEHVKNILLQRGALCSIYDKYLEDDLDPIEVPAGTDCILVIGGDGTILNAANGLRGTNIPLLGINRGTLGFLAEIDINELSTAIDGLLKDQYQLEKRIMLNADIIRNGEHITTLSALNDFVISRCASVRIIGISVKINGNLIEHYQADGVILCTPTGSTGYNLSAGGPIINPTCKNFVLTPICSHSLASRSVVLAKEDEVTIRLDKLRKAQREEAIVSYDGREGMRIYPGDQVKIYKAEETIPFIKTKEISFITILKEKLL